MPVGVTWHGRRFFHKKDTPKGRGQPWSLHLETRDGDKFTGSIKDGVIELEFKGRGLVDEEVEGAAVLSRKKPKD